MTALAPESPLTLPPGKTYAEAIRIAKQHREVIWRTISGPEDRRIDALRDACIAMCQTDRSRPPTKDEIKSGKALATLAIYA